MHVQFPLKWPGVHIKNVIKKATEFGKGYVPPKSEALRTTLLKKTRDRVIEKLS